MSWGGNYGKHVFQQEASNRTNKSSSPFHLFNHSNSNGGTEHKQHADFFCSFPSSCTLIISFEYGQALAPNSKKKISSRDHYPNCKMLKDCPFEFNPYEKNNCRASI